MDAKDAVLWLLGLVVALIGWFAREARRDINGLKEDHSECKLDLAHFKAEVAKDYAKETTVQQSLARIHARIDSLPGEIVDIIKRVK